MILWRIFSYNYDFELSINNDGVENFVGDINLLSIVLKNIIANSSGIN